MALGRTSQAPTRGHLYEAQQMSKTTLLIDAPTPFAPLSEWTAFLAELQDLAKEHGPTPQIDAAIREAETMIAEKASE